MSTDHGTGTPRACVGPRKNSPRNIFEPPIIKLSTVSSPRRAPRVNEAATVGVVVRSAEQSGSRLHNHRMPSHLFSCHHGCSRDIKRQFKDDWMMTHDTPAIGRTTAFYIPLSRSHSLFPFLSLSLSLFLVLFFLFLSVSLAFLSLPWRRRDSRRIFLRPVDIDKNMPVSVAVGTCTVTKR